MGVVMVNITRYMLYGYMFSNTDEKKKMYEEYLAKCDCYLFGGNKTICKEK